MEGYKFTYEDCYVAMLIFCIIEAPHAAIGGCTLQIWANLRVPSHSCLAKFRQKQKRCYVVYIFEVYPHSERSEVKTMKECWDGLELCTMYYWVQHLMPCKLSGKANDRRVITSDFFTGKLLLDGEFLFQKC